MRAFNDIVPYAVAPRGRGFALWLGTDLIEADFPSEGDAYGYAHDLLDAAEDEAAALADFDADQFREAA